jgi:hypothetical protein
MQRRVAVLVAVGVIACSTAAASQSSPYPDSVADEKLVGKYAPHDTTDEVTRAHSTFVILGGVHGPRHGDIRGTCTVRGGAVVLMALGKESTPAGDTSYVLTVAYSGPGWIFQGQSPLRLLADTTLIQLPSNGQPSQEKEAGAVYENAGYTPTVGDLRRLAAATTVKARVSGRSGNCTFPFPDGMMATLRQFVHHDVPAE